MLWLQGHIWLLKISSYLFSKEFSYLWTKLLLCKQLVIESHQFPFYLNVKHLSSTLHWWKREKADTHHSSVLECNVDFFRKQSRRCSLKQIQGLRNFLLLQQLQKLKMENERLRSENRALTRVVTKLTSSANARI